jgi:hypothetical protein
MSTITAPTAGRLAGRRPFADRVWWSTPRLLQAGLGLVWLAAIVALVVTSIGFAELRQAVQTIGRDTAPNISAAQDIRTSLADMDADAANELLGVTDASGASRQAFEERRTTVSQRLVDASRNIAYGQEEQAPIATLSDQFGVYLELVEQARALQAQDPAAALAVYRQATALMHTTLLPAADALDAANDQQLNQEYAARRASAGLLGAAMGISALLLLASLIGLQVFLGRRTRRTFNLPLLAATLVALVFTVRTGTTFAAAMEDLRSAKQDAFDSVYALTHARSVAYDANGEESRYLLDPANAAQSDQAFHTEAAQLVDRPVTEDLIAASQHGNVPFRGYLADELNNITYTGELQAAIETLRAFGAYLTTDGEIRALEQSGQHQAAIDLDVGTQPGQSNWAFAQFDDALGRTLGINQREFTAAVDRATADLAGSEYLGPVAAVLIILLAWLGLRPRLREYS